jgi:hypothetical protein
MMEAFLVFVPKPWLVLMITSWLKWLGLAIAIWALIGARRAASPRCARCGYALGPTPQTVCCECGADLAGKRAVRRYVRSVRRAGLWASASCIVVSLAAWPIIGFWPTSADEAQTRIYGPFVQERFDPATDDFATAWLSPATYVRWTVAPVDPADPPGWGEATIHYDWWGWFTHDRLASPARLRALHDAVLDPETRPGATVAAAVLASLSSAPTCSSIFVMDPFPDLLYPMLRDALVADPTLLEIPVVRRCVLERNFGPEGEPTLTLNAPSDGESSLFSESVGAYFGSRLLDRMTHVTVEGLTAELIPEGAPPRPLVPLDGRNSDDIAFDLSELQPSQDFVVNMRCTLVFTLVADRLRDADGAPRTHEFRIAIDAKSTRADVHPGYFP